MKKSLIKGTALVAASMLGFTGLALTPANAVTKTTVTISETSALTSLNPGTPDTNLVTNTDVTYPTGMGFAYYNDKAALIRNTKFGTFKITKNVAGDFEVTYTIKKGLKWSDGTLITGQDLLLSHILGSSQYSIKAGLGDPDKDITAFNSGGYGSPYDTHTAFDSVELSDDNMSVVVKYDAFQPDWQILGPGPSPVHALVAMAKGKKSLQGARVNAAYKNLFEDSFYSATDVCATDDTDCSDARDAARALLRKIGSKWSNAYNITTVNGSTNPLLLISNGGYILSSCVDNQSCTLVRNPLYNDGPAITGNVDTIIYKFPLDGTPAAQALNNGEIDVYDGQPTAATYALLKSYSGVTTVNLPTLTYEHIDLRVGTSNSAAGNKYNLDHNCASTYTGPFAGNSQKALDIRTAFLLTVPRQAIANQNISKLFNPASTENADVLNSQFLLPATKAYAGVVSKSGVAAFVDTTDAMRAANTAKALALVKKYYPSAAAGSNTIDVNMLFRGNARRIGENTLIATEAAKAGFNVSRVPNNSWSSALNCNDYDVAVFAWAPSSVSQTGTNANFQSDGSNNHYGWNSTAVDNATHALEGLLTDAQLTANYLAAEKAIYANAWSLPLYQWPGVAAYNSNVKNISPSSLVPNIVWNYWAWTY